MVEKPITTEPKGERDIFFVLYAALRKFKLGEYKDRLVGVGALDPEISAVYLECEEAVHGKKN